MLCRALIAIPLLLCPAAFAENIGLVDWTHVSYAATDIDGIEAWQTDTLPVGPQSPFTGSTSAAAGGTSASAGYDFSYSTLGGTFDITSAHAITSTGNDWERRSWVYGGLVLSPDVPVVVDFSGSIDANLSLPESGAGVSFSIVRIDDQVELFQIGDGAAVAGQFVIQPGAAYAVDYWLGLDGAPYGPPGVLEDGTGQAAITLTAVPEPGTLSALILAALAFARRGRHVA
ncbi:MAG: PEP-CTERM sorting domain-containing protein [Phycisphaerae bacterium]|jgi:hypothetical protein